MATLFEILNINIRKIALIPLLLASVVLMIIYITTMKYISTENQKGLLANADVSLDFAIKLETKLISEKMKSIASGQNIIAKRAKHFYLNSNKYSVLYNVEYKQDKFGLWYQTEDIGQADAMSFLFTTYNKKQIKNYLNKTQWLDLALKNIVESEEVVIASWIIDSNALIRYYPFIELHQYLSDLSNFFDWSFYYEADETHNPDKKSLWSSIYLDPAGNGWMTSYISPIYDDKNQFRAVVGVDVPINNLTKDIINDEIPFQGEVFLTDNKGMIIAISQNMNHFLDLIQLKKNDKGNLKVIEVLKPIEHNLLHHQNDNIVKQFQAFFKDNSQFGEFKFKDKTFLVESRNIENTNWKIFFLFNKNIILQESLKIEKESMQKSIYISIFGLIFLAFLIYFVYRKTLFLSQQIATPIKILSNRTQNIQNYSMPEKTEIAEVDTLLMNFFKMTIEINNHREHLEQTVLERTAELQKSNRNIKDSIKIGILKIQLNLLL